jgi:hypothetical protein
MYRRRDTVAEFKSRRWRVKENGKLRRYTVNWNIYVINLPYIKVIYKIWCFYSSVKPQIEVFWVSEYMVS